MSYMNDSSLYPANSLSDTGSEPLMAWLSRRDRIRSKLSCSTCRHCGVNARVPFPLHTLSAGNRSMHNHTIWLNFTLFYHVTSAFSLHILSYSAHAEGQPGCCGGCGVGTSLELPVCNTKPGMGVGEGSAMLGLTLTLTLLPLLNTTNPNRYSRPYTPVNVNF